MFAVIGGSGLTRIPELEITGRRIVRTPYGLPSAPLLTGRSGGPPGGGLCAAGPAPPAPAPRHNYRANIWALKSLDVVGIIAVSAVTSLNSDWRSGSLVLPDDLIDYTSARSATFFENDNCGVVHTDFTEPYDAALRQTLLEHAAARETVLLPQAVYGCLQGPRTPTRAEMRRLRRDGVDIFGMTGMPEAVLAREVGLPYAHLCGIVAHADDGAAADERSRKSYDAIEQIRRLLADW